jgi:hypothetical protein
MCCISACTSAISIYNYMVIDFLIMFHFVKNLSMEVVRGPLFASLTIKLR